MSEKCWKLYLWEKGDTKAVRQFQENNYQGDEPYTNRNKIDQSVQCLWEFKILHSCTQFIFYKLPDPNVFDLGLSLRFMLKSKIQNNFDLRQKKYNK